MRGKSGSVIPRGIDVRAEFNGGLESLEIAVILRVKVSVYHTGVGKSSLYGS